MARRSKKEQESEAKLEERVDITMMAIGAYEAYNLAKGRTTYEPFDALLPASQAAWMAVVDAVLGRLSASRASVAASPPEVSELIRANSSDLVAKPVEDAIAVRIESLGESIDAGFTG